jgi:hypothetical protein
LRELTDRNSSDEKAQEVLLDQIWYMNRGQQQDTSVENIKAFLDTSINNELATSFGVV